MISQTNIPVKQNIVADAYKILGEQLFLTQKHEEPKQPVIIGIDPALEKIGLCVLHSKYDLHLIKPTPKLKGTERLLDLRNKVLSILALYKPDLAVIEGYSYCSIGRVFELGEIGGILKVELLIAGIKTLIVSPSTIKKFMTGSGNASKMRMIAEVNKQLHLGVRNDDLADAAALAYYGLIYSNRTSQTMH